MYSKHARNDIVQMWHGFTDSPKQSAARSSIQSTVHEWYVPFSYQWGSLECTPVNEYSSPGDRSLSLQCTYACTHAVHRYISSMKIYICVAMFICGTNMTSHKAHCYVVTTGKCTQLMKAVMSCNICPACVAESVAID